MTCSESRAASQADAGRSRRDVMLFGGVVVFAFLSRVPFLGAGYGNDPDAWGLAVAARHIAASGEYVASRLPGYPVQEFVCSLLYRGGPIALNTLTALLSAAAVGFFTCSVRRLGSGQYLWAGLALALTPVIFVNSTNSMDYVWALAFILAGHHCVLVRRPVFAGCLLGVAIGCRITSVGMALPLCILLFGASAASSRRRAVTEFLLATCLVATIACMPVAYRYGWGFLSFVEPPAYPSVLSVFSRATLRTWGCVGSLAIVGGLCLTALRVVVRGRAVGMSAAIFASNSRASIMAAAVAVGVYILAYLRLPLEEGYLIPAVPFVIILLGRLMTRRMFKCVCLALCVSPLVCSVGRTASASPQTYSAHALHFRVAGQGLVLDMARGPILVSYAERLHGMAFVDRILERGGKLPRGSVIVVGFWQPQVLAKLTDPPPESPVFVHVINADQIDRFRSEGRAIYFLPEMAAYNQAVNGLDLDRAAASSLDLYWGR
ncbi:MAG: hypothetical protein ABII12_18575 [Planctomycetota bacterium]